MKFKISLKKSGERTKTASLYLKLALPQHVNMDTINQLYIILEQKFAGQTLVLDASQVLEIDPEALRALVALARKFQDQLAKKVKVRNPSRPFRDVLLLTNTERFFDFIRCVSK